MKLYNKIECRACDGRGKILWANNAYSHEHRDWVDIAELKDCESCKAAGFVFEPRNPVTVIHVH